MTTDIGPCDEEEKSDHSFLKQNPAYSVQAADNSSHMSGSEPNGMLHELTCQSIHKQRVFYR